MKRILIVFVLMFSMIFLISCSNKNFVSVEVTVTDISYEYIPCNGRFYKGNWCGFDNVYKVKFIECTYVLDDILIYIYYDDSIRDLSNARDNLVVGDTYWKSIEVI